jgi:hypothetical protein
VAGEISGHQMVGDKGGFGGRTAKLNEESVDELMQIRRLKTISGLH